MAAPTWTDVLEAIASTFTAVFTAGSLLYLAGYTKTTRQMYEITRKTYETTAKAFEEGARPIIVVLEVRNKGEERVAVLKNTGAGIAINILRRSFYSDNAANNVLASNHEMLLIIPRHLEGNQIDLRYESLTGKKLCTFCHFLEDGRVFNEYIPESESMNEDDLRSIQLLPSTRGMVANAQSSAAKTLGELRELEKKTDLDDSQ